MYRVLCIRAEQIKNAQKYMKSELLLGNYWLHADLEPENMFLTFKPIPL
jgi:hypothetical protein